MSNDTVTSTPLNLRSLSVWDHVRLAVKLIREYPVAFFILPCALAIIRSLLSSRAGLIYSLAFAACTLNQVFILMVLVFRNSVIEIGQHIKFSSKITNALIMDHKNSDTHPDDLPAKEWFLDDELIFNTGYAKTFVALVAYAWPILYIALLFLLAPWIEEVQEITPFSIKILSLLLMIIIGSILVTFIAPFFLLPGMILLEDKSIVQCVKRCLFLTRGIRFNISKTIAIPALFWFLCSLPIFFLGGLFNSILLEYISLCVFFIGETQIGISSTVIYLRLLDDECQLQVNIEKIS